MTNEEKTETTEVEKKVDVVDTSSETRGEEQEETKNIENQIDYKAIAEKATADKVSAENALSSYRKGDELFKDKKKAGEITGKLDEGEETDEEKPLTMKDLQAFQAEERQRMSNQFNATQLNDIAGQISDSDDEKKAILAVHANRTFPEGMSINDQLAEIKLIVNKDRIIGQNSELKRALNSRENVNKKHLDTQHDSIPSQADEPKVSGNRKEILKDFKYNKGQNRYEKKLSSGVLVHDPKTGKNQFIPNNS